MISIKVVSAFTITIVFSAFYIAVIVQGKEVDGDALLGGEVAKF